MTSKIFIETIKIKDGVFYDSPFHTARMNKTAKEFFKKDKNFTLTDEIIPAEYRQGLVKCRILYSDKILSIDFTPYSFRKIDQLQLVINNEIEYAYKYQNREIFDELKKQSTEEILIAKNGYITDTSYTNVVFQDKTGFYTPDTFLLPGTKREKLLQQGIIHERKIHINDLHKYDCIYLINAMMDLEDEIKIPVSKINLPVNLLLQ
ncbi:aminotransferase class IV [Paludibacteraceae bacterium OttesenSCG-928-F17]|nr:aminotransferase class IV [Paludibacteraceae bacterium OttesenSCG-928-F17]